MKSLPRAVTEDLQKYWAVFKTKKPFSCIPIDQVPEQNNAIVKGSGGAVGLTENIIQRHFKDGWSVDRSLLAC